MPAIKDYPNLFQELGHSKFEIEARLHQIYQTMFFGPEDERLYHEEADMAYVVDTGNDDVRTEGMSYAMMVAVQMNQKDVFDRLWKWAKTYMFMQTGENAGYFAWSVAPTGQKNATGPAPDGEEFFALALFFASHRFGNGAGIFDYEHEAQCLLKAVIHKGEKKGVGEPMWNPANYLIKFVPNVEFSDPSYHLPHFYRLFSEWAVPEDREFWRKASRASQDYLVKACNAETGLAAEYAEYSGSPLMGEHQFFFSDAYRVAANIGLSNLWFGNPADVNVSVSRLQRFFIQTPTAFNFVYSTGGQQQVQPVKHPVGLLATLAQGSLALPITDKTAQLFVERLWKTPLRQGKLRYYDNFLYLFAFLSLSGHYRIW